MADLKTLRPSTGLACLAFLALSLLATQQAWRPGHVVGSGVDLYGTLWFFWWQLECLADLRDPGFTDLFFYPLGKDIFAHTGNNLLDATASIPFQLLFGPMDYQKWFVVALLVGNGLAFLPLARAVMGRSWGALGASLAWVVNPYTLFELHCGRLTQAFLLFVPLAFFSLLKLEEDRRTRWAVLLGVCVALQAWTYWFMGWFLVLGLAPLVIRSWRRVPDKRAYLAHLLLGVGCCLLLVAPAVLAMAAAAGRGEVPGLTTVSAGLLGAPGQLSNNVAAGLHGYDLLEQDGISMLLTGSWGLPLLYWGLKGPARAPWVAVLLVPLAFSLGPQLNLGEFKLVMPHYMVLYDHLPFFDRLWFPYRILSVVMVPACLAVGLLMEVKGGRFKPLWVVAFALLSCLEQSREGNFPLSSTDVTPPETVNWLAQEEGALIHIPFGVYGMPVVWQTFHEQPLFGGMGENASLLWPKGYSSRLRNRFIQRLVVASRAPGFPDGQGSQVTGSDRAHRESIYREGYRWVVLDRVLSVSEVGRMRSRLGLEKMPVEQVAQEILSGLVEVLGPPVALEGRLVTWQLEGDAEVPESLQFSDADLEDDGWMQGNLVGRGAAPSTTGGQRDR